MSLAEAVHQAFCDLCQSKISGARYKCTNCPNFDTCASCFGLTGEKHPNHTFVRVHQQLDYIARYPPRSTHGAHCDSCNKTIVGPRFKCMHPECPDYDLCEDCDALPISVHPDTHPLLKIKVPGMLTPTLNLVPSNNRQPSEEKNIDMEDGSDATLESTSAAIHPPDYDAFEFATSTAWLRAVKVVLSSQRTWEMISRRQQELMRGWVEARGDNLPSDAYDYLTYSHGVAWPKAITQCTTEANFLLIRRRFLDIMNASGAYL